MHPAHQTNKVGIVPYTISPNGEWRFLVHLPIAKNPAEQDEMMWGVVRGTVRDVDGQDLRTLESLRATPPERIEPPEQTACAEAEEECGLSKDHFGPETTADHGLIDYQSLSKPPYPIRFYSIHLPNADLATLKAAATDAADLALATLPQLQDWAASGQFKPGYLPILAQIEADLPAASPSS
jgi:8-oxo-dGTP pyrophosphatase MutT (NUDIX family)